MQPKLTTKKFIEKATSIHGDRFDYSKSIIGDGGNMTIIKIICNKHGEFTTTVANHYRTKRGGCKKCNQVDTVDLKSDFVKKSIKKHGDLYDYSNVDYKASTDDVTIKCKLHGEFTQRPDVHLRGFGCQKCSGKHQYTTEEFVSKLKEIKPEYDYTKTEYKMSHGLVTVGCPSHGEFTTKAYYLLQGSGCPKCGNQVSNAEFDIYNHVVNLTDTAKQSVRMLGENKRGELDIYDDHNKIAIEFNGVYWHSSDSVDNDKTMQSKHINKTDECESLGIRLYHIFENEWCDPTKKLIWLSVLENAFGKSSKIYARKCKIGQVDSKTAKWFCDNNHLQGGGAIGSICYGLFYDDELVSLMTFGKARYSDADYELVRFCNKLGFSVVGGGSKLLKHFRKNHTGTIISYANRRWSDGNFYRQLGFEQLHISNPCYFYIKSGKLYHRSQFMKHKLDNILTKFDSSLSEVQNMYNNGYRRIWDCGNYVFKMESKID